MNKSIFQLFARSMGETAVANTMYNVYYTFVFIKEILLSMFKKIFRG